MNTASPSRPAAEKTGNRQRLIAAALDAIAEVGYAATSISEITQRAGLSHGMIHSHFKNKETLIAEAARHARDEHCAQLETHLRDTSASPTTVIHAVVSCVLSAETMNTRTVGIWHELRGAARSSAAIAAHSDTRGGKIENVMLNAFRSLAAHRGAEEHELLAHDAMSGTIALLDGIWTDFMLHSEGYDVAAARRVIFRYLHGLFPQDFALEDTKVNVNPDLRTKLTAQFDPPRLSQDVVAALLAEHFALAGDLLPLQGEREQNLRLDSTDGQRYVVKIARASDAPGAIAFQTHALQHLETHLPHCGLPTTHITREGEAFLRHSSHDAENIEMRVLDYVAGQPILDGTSPSLVLAHHAGALLGETASALAHLGDSPPPAFMPWNIENGLLDNPEFWALGQADIRAFEADLRPRYQRLLPCLTRQRMQVIHGDAHLENLLRRSPDANEVSGLIDFGDMSLAPLVCDAAILALGFAEEARDPIAMTAAAVAGYHSTCPLSGAELDLIYEAMVARQALSVLLLDAKLAVPNLQGDALKEMRAGLMDRLAPLANLDEATATAAIRAACGVDG